MTSRIRPVGLDLWARGAGHTGTSMVGWRISRAMCDAGRISRVASGTEMWLFSRLPC